MWTYQHHNFLVHQVPMLRDNYIYLIQDCQSDIVCVVDPAVAADVKAACNSLNIKPTHILNTHHHWDHTDGNQGLIDEYNVTIIGNEDDATRIKGISLPIPATGSFKLGNLRIQTFDLPGHTLGHIAFLIDDALFCGDTLFGGGCGRIMEGSFEQMWDSLQKLAALDDETKVYCAHEYTLANLKFARAIDTDNARLSQRISNDTQARMKKKPTIPSNIGLEKLTNPFLRPLNKSFCLSYNAMEGGELSPFHIFKTIRERKNKL